MAHEITGESPPGPGSGEISGSQKGSKKCSQDQLRPCQVSSISVQLSSGGDAPCCAVQPSAGSSPMQALH